MQGVIRTSSHLVMERMLDSSSSEEKERRDTEKERSFRVNATQTKQLSKTITPESPLSIAKKYCFENNLDPKHIPQIAKQIRTSIKHVPRLNASTLLNSNLLENFDMTNPPPMNRMAMLYERNMRLSEQNRKKVQMKMEYMKTLEDTTLTFQPQINPVSEMIVKRMRSQSNIDGKENRIALHQRIASLKRLKQAQEMAECTFQPNINSKKKSLDKTNSSSKFIQLYQDGIRKKTPLSANKFAQTTTFHPHINKISQMIINGVPFEQRLKKYSQEKVLKEEKSKQKQKISQSRLAHTQQKNKSPPVHRNGLPITQYLYKMRPNHSSQKSNQPLTPHPSHLSLKIYTERKLKALKQIFQILDSDHDGVISATKINISQIDKEVLRIIAPVLAEMQELGIDLTVEQFAMAGDRLMNGLLPHQKQTILKITRIKKLEEEKEKRLNSNEKSLLNTSHLRSTSGSGIIPGVSLYQHGKNRQKEREKWIQDQKLALLEREIKECSFKPKRCY